MHPIGSLPTIPTCFLDLSTADFGLSDAWMMLELCITKVYVLTADPSTGSEYMWAPAMIRGSRAHARMACACLLASQAIRRQSRSGRSATWSPLSCNLPLILCNTSVEPEPLLTRQYVSVLVQPGCRPRHPRSRTRGNLPFNHALPCD